MFALYRRLVGSWSAFFRARHVGLNLLLFAVFAVAAIRLPIDQLAHAGGLVTGAWMAWVLSRPAPRRAWPWAVFAGVLALAIALAVRPDPRWTRNRAALGEIHQALVDDDLARARTLARRRTHGGARRAGARLLRGPAARAGGDLEGALAKLRPLAASAGGAAGEEARRAAERRERRYSSSAASGGARCHRALPESCRGGCERPAREGGGARAALLADVVPVGRRRGERGSVRPANRTRWRVARTLRKFRRCSPLLRSRHPVAPVALPVGLAPDRRVTSSGSRCPHCRGDQAMTTTRLRATAFRSSTSAPASRSSAT